ncbi:DUF4307 domain-containing protein [Nocardiopsis lambiniae]|uniref:DUF4307 domain-containing protein n=1 Tax=Nocardiopsis lambiniae TaxID=3075539 RepID=A0ABU2M6U4_9ACTN|nr:DUF4307 domain-containing protein [Nocardiopsis sp. DSM 44743]MDT0327941.1 DUF4307 domain-containing protein [Nocardiopsis sp. DSM 44743]
MPSTPEEDAVKSADEPAADAAVTDEEIAPALRRHHGNGPVFFVIGAIFAVLCAVGWGYSVMSYTGLGGGVYHQVITSSVKSPGEVAVSYEVNSRNGAVCLIRALDERFVEVGQLSVTTEPGNHMVSTTVETVRQASTVEVASCREQGSQD